MGHVHLGRLPTTKKWREVVALLQDGASDADVVAASAIAAERDLERAVRDPVFVEALRLLAAIPAAARAGSFADALKGLGLEVREAPDLLALVASAGVRLDRVARQATGRTDLGELAGRALLGTIATAIGDRLPGLLVPEPEDVRVAARRFSTPDGFSTLARAFFGRLLRDSLSSWLDRTLATQIGPERRYASAGGLDAFDAALAQYAHEATRIVKEFAAGWHAKNVLHEGRVDPGRVAGFAAIAVRKIVEELARKRRPDA